MKNTISRVLKARWILALLFSFVAQDSFAMMTEVGVQYWRKKTSFDSDNYLDSESITGSVSLYFFERIALELSYTDAKAIREEKLMSGSTVISQQTVVQATQVIGADLIYVLADRKSFLQPYIKGGGAQITRRQEVKVDSFTTYTISPDTSIVPSYGAGLKIAVTDTFGIRLSYEAWQTPVGGGTFTDDSQIRAGFTWLL